MLWWLIFNTLWAKKCCRKFLGPPVFTWQLGSLDTIGKPSAQWCTLDYIGQPWCFSVSVHSITSVGQFEMRWEGQEIGHHSGIYRTALLRPGAQGKPLIMRMLILTDFPPLTTDGSEQEWHSPSCPVVFYHPPPSVFQENNKNNNDSNRQ